MMIPKRTSRGRGRMRDARVEHKLAVCMSRTWISSNQEDHESGNKRHLKSAQHDNRFDRINEENRKSRCHQHLNISTKEIKISSESSRQVSSNQLKQSTTTERSRRPSMKRHINLIRMMAASLQNHIIFILLCLAFSQTVIKCDLLQPSFSEDVEIFEGSSSSSPLFVHSKSKSSYNSNKPTISNLSPTQETHANLTTIRTIQSDSHASQQDEMTRSIQVNSEVELRSPRLTGEERQKQVSDMERLTDNLSTQTASLTTGSSPAIPYAARIINYESNKLPASSTKSLQHTDDDLRFKSTKVEDTFETKSEKVDDTKSAIFPEVQANSSSHLLASLTAQNKLKNALNELYYNKTLELKVPSSHGYLNSSSKTSFLIGSRASLVPAETGSNLSTGSENVGQFANLVPIISQYESGLSSSVSDEGKNNNNLIVVSATQAPSNPVLYLNENNYLIAPKGAEADLLEAAADETRTIQNLPPPTSFLASEWGRRKSSPTVRGGKNNSVRYDDINTWTPASGSVAYQANADYEKQQSVNSSSDTDTHYIDQPVGVWPNSSLLSDYQSEESSFFGASNNNDNTGYPKLSNESRQTTGNHQNRSSSTLLVDKPFIPSTRSATKLSNELMDSLNSDDLDSDDEGDGESGDDQLDSPQSLTDSAEPSQVNMTNKNRWEHQVTSSNRFKQPVDVSDTSSSSSKSRSNDGSKTTWTFSAPNTKIPAPISSANVIVGARMETNGADDRKVANRYSMNRNQMAPIIKSIRFLGGEEDFLKNTPTTTGEPAIIHGRKESSHSEGQVSAAQTATSGSSWTHQQQPLSMFQPKRQMMKSPTTNLDTSNQNSYQGPTKIREPFSNMFASSEQQLTSLKHSEKLNRGNWSNGINENVSSPSAQFKTEYYNLAHDKQPSSYQNHLSQKYSYFSNPDKELQNLMQPSWPPSWASSTMNSVRERNPFFFGNSPLQMDIYSHEESNRRKPLAGAYQMHPPNLQNQANQLRSQSLAYGRPTSNHLTISLKTSNQPAPPMAASFWSHDIDHALQDNRRKVPLTNGHLPPKHRDQSNRPVSHQFYTSSPSINRPIRLQPHSPLTNGHAFAGHLDRLALLAAANQHRQWQDLNELSFSQILDPHGFSSAASEEFGAFASLAASPISSFIAPLPAGFNRTRTMVGSQPVSIQAADSIEAGFPLIPPNLPFGWPMRIGNEATRTMIKVNNVAPSPAFLVPPHVSAGQPNPFLFPAILDLSQSNRGSTRTKKDPANMVSSPLPLTTDSTDFSMAESNAIDQWRPANLWSPGKQQHNQQAGSSVRLVRVQISTRAPTVAPKLVSKLWKRLRNTVTASTSSSNTPKNSKNIQSSNKNSSERDEQRAQRKKRRYKRAISYIPLLAGNQILESEQLEPEILARALLLTANQGSKFSSHSHSQPKPRSPSPVSSTLVASHVAASTNNQQQRPPQLQRPQVQQQLDQYFSLDLPANTNIADQVQLEPPANDPGTFKQSSVAYFGSNSKASKARLLEFSKSLIQSSKKPFTKLMKITNPFVAAGTKLISQPNSSPKSSQQNVISAASSHNINTFTVAPVFGQLQSNIKLALPLRYWHKKSQQQKQQLERMAPQPESVQSKGNGDWLSQDFNATSAQLVSFLHQPNDQRFIFPSDAAQGLVELHKSLDSKETNLLNQQTVSGYQMSNYIPFVRLQQQVANPRSSNFPQKHPFSKSSTDGFLSISSSPLLDKKRQFPGQFIAPLLGSSIISNTFPGNRNNRQIQAAQSRQFVNPKNFASSLRLIQNPHQRQQHGAGILSNPSNSSLGLNSELFSASSAPHTVELGSSIGTDHPGGLLDSSSSINQLEDAANFNALMNSAAAAAAASDELQSILPVSFGQNKGESSPLAHLTTQSNQEQQFNIVQQEHQHQQQQHQQQHYQQQLLNAQQQQLMAVPNAPSASNVNHIGLEANILPARTPRLPKLIPSINSMASRFRQHLLQTFRLNPSRWPTLASSSFMSALPKYQQGPLNYMLPSATNQPLHPQQLLPQTATTHNQLQIPHVVQQHQQQQQQQSQIQASQQMQPQQQQQSFINTNRPLDQSASNYYNFSPFLDQQTGMKQPNPGAQINIEPQPNQKVPPQRIITHQLSLQSSPQLQMDNSGFQILPTGSNQNQINSVLSSVGGQFGGGQFKQQSTTISQASPQTSSSSATTLPDQHQHQQEQQQEQQHQVVGLEETGTTGGHESALASGNIEENQLIYTDREFGSSPGNGSLESAEVYEHELLNSPEFAQAIAASSGSDNSTRHEIYMPGHSEMNDISGNLVTSDGTYIQEEVPSNGQQTDATSTSDSAAIRTNNSSTAPDFAHPHSTQHTTTIHHHHVVVADQQVDSLPGLDSQHSHQSTADSPESPDQSESGEQTSGTNSTSVYGHESVNPRRPKLHRKRKQNHQNHYQASRARARNSQERRKWVNGNGELARGSQIRADYQIIKATQQQLHQFGTNESNSSHRSSVSSRPRRPVNGEQFRVSVPNTYQSVQSSGEDGSGGDGEQQQHQQIVQVQVQGAPVQQVYDTSSLEQQVLLYPQQNELSTSENRTSDYERSKQLVDNKQLSGEGVEYVLYKPVTGEQQNNGTSDETEANVTTSMNHQVSSSSNSYQQQQQQQESLTGHAIGLQDQYSLVDQPVLLASPSGYSENANGERTETSSGMLDHSTNVVVSKGANAASAPEQAMVFVSVKPERVVQTYTRRLRPLKSPKSAQAKLAWMQQQVVPQDEPKSVSSQLDQQQAASGPLQVSPDDQQPFGKQSSSSQNISSTARPLSAVQQTKGGHLRNHNMGPKVSSGPTTLSPVVASISRDSFTRPPKAKIRWQGMASGGNKLTMNGTRSRAELASSETSNSEQAWIVGGGQTQSNLSGTGSRAKENSSETLPASGFSNQSINGSSIKVGQTTLNISSSETFESGSRPQNRLLTHSASPGARFNNKHLVAGSTSGSSISTTANTGTSTSTSTSTTTSTTTSTPAPRIAAQRAESRTGSTSFRLSLGSSSPAPQLPAPVQQTTPLSTQPSANTNANERPTVFSGAEVLMSGGASSTTNQTNSSNTNYTSQPVHRLTHTATPLLAPPPLELGPRGGELGGGGGELEITAAAHTSNFTVAPQLLSATPQHQTDQTDLISAGNYRAAGSLPEMLDQHHSTIKQHHLLADEIGHSERIVQIRARRQQQDQQQNHQQNSTPHHWLSGLRLVNGNQLGASEGTSADNNADADMMISLVNPRHLYGTQRD